VSAEVFVLDDLLYRWTARKSTRRWMTPLARAYLRYAPFTAGKEALWDRVVNPYLAWHAHKFVAPTVFGRCLAGDTADMIQQYLYYFGVWEPVLSAWVAQRLAPGDTFVDVGANIGYYSLLASTRVGGSGTVVAIEPHPGIFRELQGNLARNRARNVRAVNLAASDRTGRCRLFSGPGHNVGEATLFDDGNGASECEVGTAPLSDILQPAEARQARLIKIDVEGAEESVVAGMEPILSGCRADLEVVVEFHPPLLARQGRRPEDLLARFAGAGFRAYVLDNDYTAAACFSLGAERRPVRLQAPIRCETVVVFSRQDVESL
jgi:FkbM family methyltransferase